MSKKDPPRWFAAIFQDYLPKSLPKSSLLFGFDILLIRLTDFIKQDVTLCSTPVNSYSSLHTSFTNSWPRSMIWISKHPCRHIPRTKTERFVLSRFYFQPFWKIVNQDNDMAIPIDLWKIADVYSNLFHHTGWYWYQLQLYLWRLQVTLSLALLEPLNIIIDTSSYIMPKKSSWNLLIPNVFFSMWGHSLECSESPIPRCTSLIISIWRSFY